ncbi:MAG: hypothetical protein ACK55I_42970, partial [bacterium]
MSAQQFARVATQGASTQQRNPCLVGDGSDGCSRSTECTAWCAKRVGHCVTSPAHHHQGTWIEVV